jgi:flavin reductase (DIM6/NTAB) family NADH-FMN oxidoreductase RutF
MQPIGPVNALYPTPTTLVGALVNGNPNFITIAHVGIMTLNHISLGIHRSHYTNAGIRENEVFSVCLPSEALMVQTDYCGIMTGKKTDKAAIFDVFYGDLAKAPMIRECPVCMECRLERIVDFEEHDVFVGDVIQTHVHPDVLKEGKIDIARVNPLLFDMASKHYWALGKRLGKCWGEGKKLKRKTELRGND